ncbi:3-ketoacyl-CoA thiolase B, peroxisomal [Apodemus speciosus]|uniref:3-ketoacyl-CoA thiolase B, peroxisomal n=1 Tax=Apodemus speciosus TaxID=105296 RepID=A0ABQ0F6Y6_APOSI
MERLPSCWPGGPRLKSWASRPWGPEVLCSGRGPS